MLFSEFFICNSIEAFLTFAVGLSFIGIYIKPNKLIFISFLGGISITLIRIWYTMNNIPLGTHTFFIFSIFIILLTTILKQKLFHSFIAVLISTFLILWGEALVCILFKDFVPYIGIKFGARILIFLLSHIFLIPIFFITYIFKKPIFNLNNLK